MKDAWSTQTRYLVLIVVLLVMAGLVYYARALIGPLVVAALIAYVLDPAINIVNKRLRLPRKWVVPLVFLIFLGILALIPALFAPVVIGQVERAGVELQAFQENLEESLSRGSILGFPLSEVQLPINVDDVITPLLHPSELFGVVASTTENIVWVFVIFITAYYLLYDWEKLKNWVSRMVPEDYRKDARRLYRELRVVWQDYLRGQLLSMFVIGLISGIAAAAIGLPGAYVIGLIAGAFGVIPSVGSATMVAVVAIVALFTGSTYLALSNFWFAVLVTGVFTGIHLFENYWLRPRILGHSLQLHPGLIIIGIGGALAFAGVVVALIIVPILRSIEVVGHYLFHRIMALDPWDDSVEAAANEMVDDRMLE